MQQLLDWLAGQQILMFSSSIENQQLSSLASYWKMLWQSGLLGSRCWRICHAMVVLSGSHAQAMSKEGWQARRSSSNVERLRLAGEKEFQQCRRRAERRTESRDWQARRSSSNDVFPSRTWKGVCVLCCIGLGLCLQRMNLERIDGVASRRVVLYSIGSLFFFS